MMTNLEALEEADQRVRNDQVIGKPRLASCAPDVEHPLLHDLLCLRARPTS